MRKLCPNLDREDGLDTVLEVPIPDEMLSSIGATATLRWQNMRKWLTEQAFDKATEGPSPAGKNTELQLLLNVVGCPLIPCPVPFDHAFSRSIRDCSIVSCYIPDKISLYMSLTKRNIPNYFVLYGCRELFAACVYL